MNILVVGSGLATPAVSPAIDGHIRANGLTSVMMQAVTRRSPAGQHLTSTCALMTLLGNLILKRASYLTPTHVATRPDQIGMQFQGKEET